MGLRSIRRKQQVDTADDGATLAAEVDVAQGVLARYAAGATLSFGAPTRCPNCGDYGLVEQVDRVRGLSFNRCFGCSAEWVLSSRALRAVRESAGARSALHVMAPAAPGSALDESGFERVSPLDRHRSPLEAVDECEPGLTPETSRDGMLFERLDQRPRERDEDRPAVLMIGGRPLGSPAPSTAEPVVSRAVERTDEPQASEPALPSLPARGAPADHHADHVAEPMPSVHDLVRATPERPGKSRPMRLLLVEDDPNDIDVVRAILEPAGEGVIDLRTARTRADGEAAARSAEPDLVLLDLGLPDSHGLATVTQWHFNASTAPVFVMSGEYGTEILDRGRELGASGFMAKSELAGLLEMGDEGTARFIERLAAAASV